MKTQLKLTLGIFLVLAALKVNAQNKTVIYECSFDCPDCEEKVMKNIPYEKGIQNVTVNYDQKLVTIEYKEAKNNTENLKIALEKLGYNTEYKGEAVTFGVNGNCSMCEAKIEKAAQSVNGVSAAYWIAKTKQITVAFNPSVTNIDAIHSAIAAVGYDTDKVKANDEDYSKLHDCCKYDRK